MTQIVSSQFVGLLGLIPLSLGFWELFQRLRQRASNSVSDSQIVVQPSRNLMILSIIMIANGGDSLAVFTALFADTEWYLKWLVLVSALAMSLIWFNLAIWLVRINFVSKSKERLTQMLMPLLLIGIGIYIMVDSPTDIIQ
ncbi:MAG: cadmium resistance transporter [Xenococcaceae cyanobacterium MO_207.B15]|nr:cadmium resistance transporter [Xenococcaceae cyanobacterium MO_207.B15]